MKKLQTRAVRRARPIRTSSRQTIPQCREMVVETLRSSFFIVSLVLFACIVPIVSKGQYNTMQNYYWAFGANSGLRFAGLLPSPTPTPVSTNVNTYEGSASIADEAGNLLFYTDGNTVYDRLGNIMPNGSMFTTAYTITSTTQATQIVPVVGESNQYYIFSLESYIGAVSPGGCHLTYCIVDMTRNGGLGDVIPATINTPLDSGLCEKMTAVPGNNCNIWLITHSKDQPYFYAYSISSAGIGARVASTATGETLSGTNTYTLGSIKVSPDRNLISNCVMAGGYGLPTNDRLEVLRFNAATGIVSGCVVLNTFPDQYDAEFSPNSQVLYSHALGGRVYQYNVAMLPSIPAGVIVAAPLDYGGAMKLGPDGKIYCQTRAGFLDVINSPNTLGTGCGYVAHAYTIPISGGGGLGLPNAAIKNTASITGPVRMCMPATVTLTGSPTGGTWTSSNLTVASVGYTSGVLTTGTTPGTVIISYTAPSGCRTRSVITVNAVPSASASISPSCYPLCPNSSASVVISGTAGATVYYSSNLPGVTGSVITLPAGTGYTSVTIPTSTLAAGSYFFTISSVDKDGCVGLGTSYTIPVAYPTCSLALHIPPGKPASWTPCYGDTYNMEVSGPAGTYTIMDNFGVTYTVTIPSGSSMVVSPDFQMPGASPDKPCVMPYGITTICVKKIVSECGCVAENINDAGPPLCCMHVYAAPVPSFTLAYDGPACTGQPIGMHFNLCRQVTWPPPYTYAWASGSFSPSSTAPSVSVVSPVPGTTTYSLTITDMTNGCTFTNTVNVTVNPGPPPIAGNTTLCLIGQTTSLTNSLPGGTWSSSNASVASVSASGLVTAMAYGTATITYKMQWGCFVTAVITVSNAAPSITGTTTVVCTAPAVTTLYDAAPGGTWSGVPGTVDPVSGGYIIGYTYPGTALLTYTLPTGCSATTMITYASAGPTPPVSCYSTYVPTDYCAFHYFFNGPVGYSVDYDAMMIDMSTLSSYSVTGANMPLPTPTTQVPEPPGNCVVWVHFTALRLGRCVWPIDCFAASSKPGRTDAAEGAGVMPGVEHLVIGNALMVVPNPTKGTFVVSGRITALDGMKEAIIEVVDIVGRTVVSEVADVHDGAINKDFSLSNEVANGVYFVKIKGGQVNTTLRFTLDR